MVVQAMWLPLDGYQPRGRGVCLRVVGLRALWACEQDLQLGWEPCQLLEVCGTVERGPWPQIDALTTLPLPLADQLGHLLRQAGLDLAIGARELLGHLVDDG
ncbi:hypothetical protein FALCPG4_19021 [Fusarium falciforme]